MLGALRGAQPAELPKGMSRESLDAVVSAIRAAGGFSAAEAAGVLGTSRITGRRCLEYLTEIGLAQRRPRYGGAGRPEVEYRWAGTDAAEPDWARVTGPVPTTVQQLDL